MSKVIFSQKIESYLRHRWSLLFLIILLGLILRFFAPTTTWGYLSPDEARYLKLALEMVLQNSVEDATFKPGLPLFILGIMYLVGVTELAGYLISQLVGLFIIPTVYAIGKELRSVRSGLVAAFLFAISGPFIHHSSRILTDLPSVFFSLVAILLIVKGFNSEERNLSLIYSIGSGISFIISVLIRPTAISLFGGFLIMALYYRQTRGSFGKTTELIVGGLISIILPFIGLVLVSTTIGLGFIGAVTEALTHFISGLSVFQVGWNLGVLAARGALVLMFSITTYPGQSIFYFIAFVFSIVALRDACIRRGKSDVLLVSWLAVYCLFYILAGDIVAWEDWRYMFPIFAPLVLLISFSIDKRIDAMSSTISHVNMRFRHLARGFCIWVSNGRHRIIGIGILPIVLIGLQVPTFIVLPIILFLVILVIRQNETKTQNWVFCTVFLLMLPALSNQTTIVSMNVISREDSIQDWELSAPQAESLEIPTSDNGINVWINQFELPFIQKPSYQNLSEEGVFLWSDGHMSRNSFIIGWNNTEREISGEIRIRGFTLSTINPANSEYSSYELSSSGYYTYIKFSLNPSSSLMTMNISVIPIFQADHHAIEIDIFDERITSIIVGRETQLLPYTLVVKWISLHLYWSALQNTPLDIEIETQNLNIEAITFVNRTSNPVTNEIISDVTSKLVLTTNYTYGHIIISYGPMSENIPRIILDASSEGQPVTIYAEEYPHNDGKYETDFVSINDMYPEMSSSVFLVAPLVAGICLLFIGLIWFFSKKFILLRPFETLVTILVVSLAIHTATLMMNGEILSQIQQLGTIAIIFNVLLSIRLGFIVGGLFLLFIGLWRMKNESKVLQPLAKLSANFGKPQFISVVGISLVVM
ncbi:MAG: ArnT family glycosyltransferase, partial [Candidatus Thorarchaeota archaeon]